MNAWGKGCLLSVCFVRKITDRFWLNLFGRFGGGGVVATKLWGKFNPLHYMAEISVCFLKKQLIMQEAGRRGEVVEILCPPQQETNIFYNFLLINLPLVCNQIVSVFLCYFQIMKQLICKRVSVIYWVWSI